MIEFRGKNAALDKWIYGSYNAPFRPGVNTFIRSLVNNSLYVVDPATVGQYTGLNDKNDNKIFAGDIVRFGDDIFQIVFADACFWINNPHDHYSMELHTTIGMGPDVILGQCGVEVIGNIHDDPDLLKANDG